MEKLKNVHLQQQVGYQKQLVENYQKQIEQLSKSLDKANTSIQDFAQTKLLKMKSSLSAVDNEHQTKSETPEIQRSSGTSHPISIIELASESTKERVANNKKGWWPF